GMVDEVSTELEGVAKEADVILLCVPILVSLCLIEEFSALELKDTVLITDAGSTKSAIVDAAEDYLAPRKINFIGGQPM
ncbi:prephenate dehydrogenase/arogenate dehydrogenase family protein, partial [Streptococcus suis]